MSTVPIALTRFERGACHSIFPSFDIATSQQRLPPGSPSTTYPSGPPLCWCMLLLHVSLCSVEVRVSDSPHRGGLTLRTIHGDTCRTMDKAIRAPRSPSCVLRCCLLSSVSLTHLPKRPSKKQSMKWPTRQVFPPACRANHNRDKPPYREGETKHICLLECNT